MIAACPKCGVRYRIERERLRPGGVRLRCSRCEAIFRVSPPEPRLRDPAPAPVASDFPRGAPRAADERGPTQRSAAPLVLVADPNVDAGKVTVGRLADWGFRTLLAHDGVEAILAIQRSLPQLVILDAGLPKMFGFQVCELVKRNESLRSIQVVLVGAIHDPERYRRPPAELYGADAYVERPALGRDLGRVLRELGFPGGVESAPAKPAVPPAPAKPATPPARVRNAVAHTERVSRAPARVREPGAAAGRPAAARPASSDARSLQLAQAERLARIIVSDIVLYNPEKLDEAIRAGNVLEALDAEMEEGRALFRQRIDASVRDERDFLSEELLRVARLRATT